ncbi:mts domain-containing protein [Citrus sinensis]|uniref:Mts domain-containing protein n=1 Tax=Citrus sinensis TaxID=2711 RepID=A0ACB8N3R0_CITSI|nr:mts domain-containing protein [Citrus sinensis]
MPPCLLSARPPSPVITCRVSLGAVRNPPPPAPPSSLPLDPPAANLPSLTCALQCPHFQSCSGCTHEFNLHRPIIVDDATDFFKSSGLLDFTFDSCRLYGWRCRAKLAVRGTSTSPLIGLYQEGTHNVVDIPHCKAHHPRINAAVELLRQGIKELNVEPYDEDERTGDLRYVQFLWRNGGSRSREHYIHSVWANFQTSTNNVIFGNRWRHLLGETDFWENVGGIDISLAPSSFGQANTRAFDILLRKLQKYVPYGASVTDLSVKCVEINKESQLSFEKTVSRLPESVDGNISWHNADNSIEPLSWLVGSDVLVVDPPRKGLDSSLVHALQSIGSAERKAKSLSESSSSMVKEEKRPWILRAKEASVQIGSKTNSENQSLPQTLIYISCGWESFKEDCKSLLSSKAWHLEKAHGFNFFPGTQSIEVLAVFKRGQGLKKKKLAKKKKKNAF